MKQIFINNVTKTAQFGERVLCFAKSEFTIDNSNGDTAESFEFNGEPYENANWFIENACGDERQLTFIAFMSLIHPTRKKVSESIASCNDAGIENSYDYRRL